MTRLEGSERKSQTNKFSKFYIFELNVFRKETDVSLSLAFARTFSTTAC